MRARFDLYRMTPRFAGLASSRNSSSWTGRVSHATWRIYYCGSAVKRRGRKVSTRAVSKPSARRA